MLSRSPRELVIHRSTTPATVGPGSYSVPENSRRSPPRTAEVAPFSSTAERDLSLVERTRLEVPGPGAYDSTGSQSKKPLRSKHFISTAARFDNSRAHTAPSVGPGSYEQPNLWKKASTRPRPKTMSAKLTWVRVNTAPSIPVSSYGYDETPDGTLVMHKPPPPPAEVGPGYYNPKPLRSSKGTIDWSRDRSQRHLGDSKEVSTAPGPGSYEVSPPRSTNPAAMAPSASFSSKVRRLYEQREKDSRPGPGHYEVVEPSRSRSPSPDAKRNSSFGSTSKRVFELDPRSYTAPFHMKTPGPGTYNPQPVTSPTRRSNPNAPFTSSAARFAGPKPSQVPGPGEYQPEVREHRKPRDKSKTTPFGSTAPRFPPKHQVDDIGPGAYYSPPSERPQPQRRSHMFASRTVRDFSPPRTEALTTPGPGEYDVTPKSPPRRSFAGPKPFLSTAKRFEEKTVDTPGPGAYSPETGSEQSASLFKAATPQGMSSFRSREPRFKDDSRGGAAPGPGSYDLAQPLVRPSFNVTLTPLLALVGDKRHPEV